MNPSKPNTPPANWVLPSSRKPTARLRLYCFPHAGGSAAFFQPWVAAAPASLEIAAIELPGHGSRFREALQEDLPELVRAVHRGLKHELQQKPFALFGHSSGALLAFEWARLLLLDGRIQPVHFFACGHQAPSIPEREPIAGFGDAELIDWLTKDGGTSPEVLANLELLSLVLPIIRADAAWNESYTYVGTPQLTAPVSAFGSTGEWHTEADIRAWQAVTTNRFDFEILEGGHFAAFDPEKGIFRRIVSTLGA